MELTSSTIELKIIDTISFESTNIPSPFETISDWDHFTAEKKPWGLRNNLPSPEVPKEPVAWHFLEFWRISVQLDKAAPKGGGGCWDAAPIPPNRNLKNTDFVVTMIANVLSD
jgi:hypothetical protein